MHRRYNLPSCLLLSLLAPACTVPLDDVDDPNPVNTGSGTATADDEVGLPTEATDPPESLPQGYCLTGEDPPYYGYRHHCGGFLDASITGEAQGQTIDIPISYDFGPSVPGDSYQSPKVAACCGEYDFEQSASSQPAYWDNCLYDAVQQMCASLPYRLWDLAKDAGPLVADALNELGNDLTTSARQSACLAELYGAGPAELNIISGNQWSPVAGIWLNVDFLEVIEVALPENEAEWITCNSIFENDDSVNPDRDPGKPWKGYLARPAAGALRLRGPDSLLGDESTPLSPHEAGATLVLAVDGEGTPTLGDLHLELGALTLAGVPVERAGLALLRQTMTVPRGDGSFAVQQPALIGAAVRGGDTLTTQLRASSELVLRPIPGGWRLEAFALAYVDGEGQTWTVVGEALDFLAP